MRTQQAPVFASHSDRSGRIVLLGWLLTKFVTLGVWFGLTPGFQGDPRYYWASLVVMERGGPQAALTEYPTPMLWLLGLPRLLASSGDGYVAVFVVSMFVLDALFTLVLWLCSGQSGERRWLPAVWWVIFTLLLGRTIYMRFDMIPALLAAAAILLLQRNRHFSAGAAVALGAGTKVWPALLVVGLLRGRRRRTGALAGFVLTGAVLVAASVLYAGVERLLSPLSWQSGRGLQVESVWASVPMLQRRSSPAWEIYWAPYKAWEIGGPGVSGWLVAARAATVLAIVAIAAATVLFLRADAAPDSRAAAVLMVFVPIAMIIANKAFSPQYMLWIGAPLAAALTLPPLPLRPGRLREHWLGPVAITTLTLAALTQLVYPILYGPLVGPRRPLAVVAALVLVLRNAGVAVLAAQTLLLLWRLCRSRRGERPPQVHPAVPPPP